MEKVMHRVFRRTGKVRILCGEKVFDRRGVVMPVTKGVKLQPFSAEPCGRLAEPLYRYMGDGLELPVLENARLKRGEEEFRVLQADFVEGHAGKVYVEALLERVMTDDWQ